MRRSNMNNKISIIVPIFNEAGSIVELLSRIKKALSKEDYQYEVILIDDNSTDNTDAIITNFKNSKNVQFFKKRGQQGKSFSLIEGFEKAKGEIIVMIDGDLQYPPESIPEMIKSLETADIIIAKRKQYEDLLIRKVLSNSFRLFFGKALFGLGHDIQSGLKVMTREVIETVKFIPKSAWTFDLEFLHRAKSGGFTITEVDTVFARRKNDLSKVAFIQTTLEIGLQALRLRTKKIAPLSIQPQKADSMIGAGVGYKKNKYITHTTIAHQNTAIITFSTTQKLTILFLLVTVIAGLITSPLLTAQIVVALLSAIYFVDVLFNLYLIIKSLAFPQEIVATDQEITDIEERRLPIYSILCPLYREAHILPQFLDAIDKISWPKNKLDVLLLLEVDDQTTIDKVKLMDLPSYVRVLVVPHSLPKTKPKACNYGLAHARGEYLVIYDAEDVPDPLQLKKAYLGFQKVSPNTVCLQAKLNYYNPHQNLLTRFFTAEYSLWFDVTLTGLQSINTIIPLGGTSNHFKTKSLKEIEGWDPFNVTEDADLGIRLFKYGYKTAIIDSVTLEEANSRVGNWLRQRSRWIKGYMQTYLVHVRQALDKRKINGRHSLLFQLTIGGKIAFLFINPFLWVATIAYFTLYAYVGASIEALYPSVIFYMALSSLVFGNFLFLYYYMIGVAKKGQWSLMKYIFLIPIYWLMISVAAAIALFQLIFKPHYWEKTVHGFHFNKNEDHTLLAEEIIATDTKRTFLPANILGLIKSLRLKKNYFLGLVLIGSMGVGSILNFLFNAYLGRVLKFEEFALISLIGSFLAISSMFSGAFSTTINYKSGFLIGKYGENSAYNFWKKIRVRGLLMGVTAMILWLLLSPILENFFKASDIIPLILFSPILLIVLTTAADNGYLAGKFRFGSIAIINIVEPLVKLTAAIVLVKLGLSQLTYTAIPLSIIAIFLLGWYLAFAKKPNGEEGKKTPIINDRFPQKFYLVSFLTGFSIIFFTNVDVILANHYLSSFEAGQYALVSLIGKMIYFFGSFASTFITPLVSRNEGQNKNSDSILYYTLLSTALLVLIGFIVLGVFGHITAPILFGSKANSITRYLLLVCSALALFTISKVFTSFYLIKKHFTFSLTSLLISIVATIAIAFFHHSLSEFILVMSIVWASHLAVNVTLHLTINQIKKFESAVLKWLDHSTFNKINFGHISPKTIILNQLQNWTSTFVSKVNQQQSTFDDTSSDKLSILIFNWRDTKHVWAGGAEVYVHELAKRWVTQGNRVTLFCGNGTKQPQHETIDGVEIFRRGNFYSVYIWGFFYYIFMFRGKHDIIIDSENGIPFFTPLYAKEKIFLLIHHVHQEVFRKSLRWPLAQLALFLEAKMMPVVYHNIQVITVSPSSKAEIMRHKLTAIEPIIIYNGVDLTSFKPAKKSAQPMILYLGRLQYYKSLNIFIKAAKIVLEKMPNAKFIIAGEGEERKKLQRYAVKLGIADKIKFLGKVSEEKKIRLFQKAWAFVNTSYMEGWGLTTIEANACGTPAVASNVPGLRDSLKNPHTGFLVDYGDYETFAENIIKLIKDEKLRKEMSEESIRWASNFSWEKSADKLYETISHNKSASNSPAQEKKIKQLLNKLSSYS